MSSGKWYVLHTYTGYEDKVKSHLDMLISSRNLSDKIFNILIPKEEVVEIKNNKRKVFTRKFFPGYILLEMEIDDLTWGLIKAVPGVTGFLGGSKPVPLNEEEIKNILELTNPERAARPKPAVMFERNETVRIIEGPFANFTGLVEEVNLERAKLKVMVTIFGRATPVELDFLQVEKI
jgi:transcription termination/antitermination protein NusG